MGMLALHGKHIEDAESPELHSFLVQRAVRQFTRSTSLDATGQCSP